MVLFHAAHAARVSCNTIFIRTVDTDVVVLAVAYAANICMQRYPFFMLYLGVIRCLLLQVEEAAFQIWKAHSDVTAAFSALSAAPVEVTPTEAIN